MFKRLWQTSPELIATAALMLIVLAGAIVGLAVDPTVITGAPAWLKPAKFAVSITIYTVTLAWIFTLIPEWTRTRRVVGWVDRDHDGDRDGHHQRPGLARDDEPLQRRDARSTACCSAIMGPAIVVADAVEHCRRGRALAAAFRGHGAWLGAAARHDASPSSARSPVG